MGDIDSEDALLEHSPGHGHARGGIGEHHTEVKHIHLHVRGKKEDESVFTDHLSYLGALTWLPWETAMVGSASSSSSWGT